MIGRVVIALLFGLVLGGSALAQTCSGLTALTNGTNADATQVMNNFTTLLNCINTLSGAGALRGYLSGLTLSTVGSSVNFGVAAGVATSDDATTSMPLATSLSKTTAAWAVGSGAGSLDTGTIANSTWYHVFLIERTDTNVVDVLISLSATAPTMPASYGKKRRVGSMKTDGSGHWVKFLQAGDVFMWDAPVTELSSVAISSVTTKALSGVPVGLKLQMIMAGNAYSTGNNTLFAWPADQTGGTSNSIAQIPIASSYTQIYGPLMTDANASIKLQATGSTSVVLFTTGYVDRRGRDD